MQIMIGNVLTSDELATVQAAMDQVAYVDGRKTAGFAARLVKNNRQVEGSNRAIESIRTLIGERIMTNDVFRMAARPKALSPLLLSRYDPGMHYGSHVDDAVMQGMRTDVSFTLFLADPANYDGGELIIETSSGEEAVKLDAGSMIAYPSTALHRVGEVTRGSRFAAVGWARSYIRDPAQREMLFDLDTARRQMFDRDGKTQQYDLVAKSLANLTRMWVED